MMKNVVHCAERDVSGLSEADKQYDIQWAAKVRRRLSSIALFVNRNFVQEMRMCTSPPVQQWGLYVERINRCKSVTADMVVA